MSTGNQILEIVRSEAGLSISDVLEYFGEEQAHGVRVAIGRLVGASRLTDTDGQLFLAEQAQQSTASYMETDPNRHSGFEPLPCLFEIAVDIPAVQKGQSVGVHFEVSQTVGGISRIGVAQSTRGPVTWYPMGSELLRVQMGTFQAQPGMALLDDKTYLVLVFTDQGGSVARYYRAPGGQSIAVSWG